jgi:gluconolactonase
MTTNALFPEPVVLDPVQLRDIEVVTHGLVAPIGVAELRDGALLVTEAMAGRVSRIDTDGAVSRVAEVRGNPRDIAIGPDGGYYVCIAARGGGRSWGSSGIARIDPVSGHVETIYAAGAEAPLYAPHDLVFDSAGGMWFTDGAGPSATSADWLVSPGAIYYAAPDGSAITRVYDHVDRPHGIGLSPDESVLYWSELATRSVHRRRLVAPGTISAESVGAAPVALRTDPWAYLLGLPGAQELAGIAIEADGRVCVTTILDSGITVVSPKDGSYQKYTFPPAVFDEVPGNMCFGGSDLRTAYITLTRTGRLIACPWPRAGLRLAYQEPRA